MWDGRIVVSSLAAVAVGAPFAAWLGIVIATAAMHANATPGQPPAAGQVVPAQVPTGKTTVDPTHGGPEMRGLPSGPASPTAGGSPTATSTATVPVPTTGPPAGTGEPEPTPTGEPEPTLPLPTGSVLPGGGGQGAGGGGSATP